MNDKHTTADMYQPSAAELRMLEVCLNPSMANKNVTQKCKAADVSRDTWYKVMKRPEFIKLLNETCMDLLKGKVNDIINATYNFATSNSKCSQDRKMLLTMAGVYSDKVETKVEGEQDFNVNIKVIE